MSPRATLDKSRYKNYKAMMVSTVYSTTRWRHLRKQILSPGRLCERCRLVLATDCHHVKSPWDGWTFDEELAFSLTNIETICRWCHTLHHKLEVKGKTCSYCGTPVKEEADGKKFCPYCKAEGFGAYQVRPIRRRAIPA